MALSGLLMVSAIATACSNDDGRGGPDPVSPTTTEASAAVPGEPVPPEEPEAEPTLEELMPGILDAIERSMDPISVTVDGGEVHIELPERAPKVPVGTECLVLVPVRHDDLDFIVTRGEDELRC